MRDVLESECLEGRVDVLLDTGSAARKTAAMSVNRHAGSRRSGVVTHARYAAYATVSLTVKHPRTASSCSTKEMNLVGSNPATPLSLIKPLPGEGLRRPQSRSRRDDLPDPDGPMTAER